MMFTLITVDGTFFFPSLGFFLKNSQLESAYDHLTTGIILVYAIGLQLSSEGVQTNPQRSGGTGFVAVHLVVNIEYMLFFHLIEGGDRIGGRGVDVL